MDCLYEEMDKSKQPAKCKQYRALNLEFISRGINCAGRLLSLPLSSLRLSALVLREI